MRNWKMKLGIFAGVMIAFTALALGQDSASMTGVVTDLTGAVIPGTVVVLTNPSTGNRFTQTTDNKGSYRFANVPPNRGYRASFSHQGFSTAQISNITLDVAITRTQDVKLAVGTNETIDVSAGNATVTLNTTDASIGNNIDVEQLNELPIQDRTAGITTLFTQQAGVDPVSDSVTGARTDQTEVTVDGLDVNDLSTGQAFQIVGNAPVDSVNQFTGTVAGLNSSIGTGSGGQFQLVTKNGTNAFHGNINEYHRDTTTVANTYFNNLNGLPRTPLIRNQFGGNIGGPIKKDKLFFFFDIADSRIIQSSTSEPIVPLSNLHGPNPTLNYINNGPGCDDTSRINTAPQCISSLPATAAAGVPSVQSLDPAGIGFNPAVLAFINSRYPVANDPTQGDGVNTGGYRFTTPTPDLETTYVGRIDYNLTPTQKIFGRFTINRRNAVETLPQFPTDPLTHPEIDRSYGYVVSHVWAIGANKVNEFYYGDNISKLSFPDLYNPTGENQYSFSGLGGPYTSYDGQQRRIPVPVVRDDFNWQLGTHTLTMGGTFKFIKTHSNLISNFNYVYVGLQGSAFSTGLDASVRPSDINMGAAQVGINDYDSLFATSLGAIGTISTNYNYNNAGMAQPAGSGGPRAYRFYETEAYFGDTWKVNKKLTLSYGVRYQLYTVPYEVNGNQSVATILGANGGVSGSSNINLNSYINDRVAQSAAGNTSTNGLPLFSYVLGGKANNGPDLYAPSYKDFAPRFAFSYNASPKTVINAGAGIVYDRSVINAVNFLQDQLSYLFSNTQINQFGDPSGAVASLATDTRVGTNLAYPASLNPAPSPITIPFTPYVDGTGTPYGLANGQVNFTVNPTLKDPYSIALNAGMQQEFPGHLIMKLNYVGRFGRRLLANADAAQVIDFPDKASSQMMSQAFASITTQTRAGVKYSNITAQPWFEDIIPAGTGVALAPEFGIPNVHNNTQFVTALEGVLVGRGDISDMLQNLASYSYTYGFPLLPTNVGIPSQFGTNAYLTNQGSSNYNGLLLTMSKNFSQGLRFDFNYTWAHSIDNTSLISNSNPLTMSNPHGFVCDILAPRACRGDSDFDVRQELTSNFLYDLPVGRGRMFLSSAPRWVDETIGGWSVSGLPSYRTGLAVTAFSDAYLASFENNDPAIFTGNRNDLRTKINKVGNTVYSFAGGVAGSAKVASEFRGPIGLEYGQRNYLRGPGGFAFDAGLAKRFPILEDKLNLTFRADAFNVLNHPVFAAPTPNIVTTASTFGQITAISSTVNPRVGQFSLRLEF